MINRTLKDIQQLIQFMKITIELLMNKIKEIK